MYYQFFNLTFFIFHKYYLLMYAVELFCINFSLISILNYSDIITLRQTIIDEIIYRYANLGNTI